MEKKTILEKIKALAFEDVTPEVVVALEEEVAVELAEAMTDKGLIKYEVLEVGAAVVVVMEDETEEPADGTYVLEDGTTVVAVNGVVESVTDAEVVEEEQSEVNPLVKEVADLKELVTAIAEKFSELHSNFEAFKKAPAKEEFKAPKKETKFTKKANAISELAKFRNKK